MEIIRLPRGERAAHDTDCIHVGQRDDRYQLTGSVLAAPTPDDDVAESNAIVAGATYDRADEAEAAGVAWAEAQGVATLYVSYDPPAE